MVININATEDEIVEVLLISLENLSEIKLKESNEQESKIIKNFIEREYEKGGVLDVTAQKIIDHKSKLSEEEKNYHKKLYTIVKQDNTLEKTQPTHEPLPIDRI